MKYFINICILIGLCVLMNDCKEKEFKFVLGADNEYTYDLSGSGYFDEIYFVTSDELIEMTEDLDDELRTNINQVEIEYVKAQLLSQTGNTAGSVTLSVYIDWNNDMSDVDTLFTKKTVPVTSSESDFVLITELTIETIDLLKNKLFHAVRLTDVSPFTVGAVGVVNDGEIEAVLKIVIKASAVTSDRYDLPFFIISDE